MDKMKAIILTVALSAILLILFVVSLFVEVEPNVPSGIFLFPISAGYFFGDIAKSFYKWLIKKE